MSCINHDLLLLTSKNQNLFFGCLFCKTALPAIHNFKKTCNCSNSKWKFKILNNEYYIYCDSCLKKLNII